MRFIALGSTAVALVLTLLPAIHRPDSRLLWNVSPSVPLGLYHVVPATQPRAGDLVALRPPPRLAAFMASRRYVEQGTLLIKPIAAVAGATVCREGLIVTINGRRAAKALREDRFGRPLPSWSGCRKMGRDQIFLIAQAKRDSFDSRYFLGVSQSAIVGRAIPLWTWQ